MTVLLAELKKSVNVILFELINLVQSVNPSPDSKTYL